MIKTYKYKESLLGGIYKIYNIKNNRIYIGSTICFRDRCNEHLRELNKGTHDNGFLQNDYNKNHTDDFIFEIIEFVVGDELARTTIEQIYIDLVYDNHKNCYNLKDKAIRIGTTYIKEPEKRNEKISKSQKEKWQDPIFKQKQIAVMQTAKNQPDVLQVVSDKAKERWNNGVSELCNVGRDRRWANPDNIEKAREQATGRTHTQESKDLMSKIRNENPLTDKQLEASLNNLSKCHDEEHYEQHSKTMKEKWKDPEYSAKITKKLVDKNAKPIIITMILTGEKRYFESLVELTRNMPLSESYIRKVINGKISKKYIFTRISKEEYQDYLDSL